uniref:Uncharacterized protein n=1 Tax=Populus alba TaxID=43335 RepID=A0A4U5PKT8_POPAL|nr:hypothetical protein D5086_0000214730 [Populus alba]
MYTGGDWLQYFRCAAVVSDLRTHKELILSPHTHTLVCFVHPKPNVFLPSVMSQRAAEELLEKRERPENGSMRVPKMGECFCFLFWADMHYFAAMSTCLVLRGQRTASVSSTQSCSERNSGVLITLQDSSQ